jgi:hypothetical protein
LSQIEGMMNFGLPVRPVKAKPAFGVGDLGVRKALDDQAVIVGRSVPGTGGDDRG